MEHAEPNPTTPDSAASPAMSQELKDLIRYYSTPEFFDEMTRLFGEAKKRAIQERDQLSSELPDERPT